MLEWYEGCKGFNFVRFTALGYVVRSLFSLSITAAEVPIVNIVKLFHHALHPTTDCFATPRGVSNAADTPHTSHTGRNGPSNELFHADLQAVDTVYTWGGGRNRFQHIMQCGFGNMDF